MDYARRSLPLLLLLGQVSARVGNFDLQTDDDSCPHPAALSCPLPAPPSVDSCCVNSPGGHFLLTQFWDAYPKSLGPEDAFTLHGLWPDLCNTRGQYEQFCDRDRTYTNISGILADSTTASVDLLPFIDSHWLSLSGDNNDLWYHEWNKHGTCVSTLSPACYGSSSTPSSSSDHQDVVDYFTYAALLYRTLDTYQVLADAGVTPSETRQYTLPEIVAPLLKAHGFATTLRCTADHQLDEVWHHFSVRGPLSYAPPFSLDQPLADVRAALKDVFVPTSPDGIITNCPATGIKYRPKRPARGRLSQQPVDL